MVGRGGTAVRGENAAVASVGVAGVCVADHRAGVGVVGLAGGRGVGLVGAVARYADKSANGVARSGRYTYDRCANAPSDFAVCVSLTAAEQQFPSDFGNCVIV